MTQKIVSHWYKYPPSKGYGTMCGREIIEKTKMAMYPENITCKSCKSILEVAERRMKQRKKSLDMYLRND